MAYEMRPGQGSAWPNEGKTTDKHPDYKGRVCLPNGETRWVSVWNKTTAAGQPYISFAVGDVCQQQGQPVYSAAHDRAKANGYQPQPGGLDDDVPF